MLRQILYLLFTLSLLLTGVPVWAQLEQNDKETFAKCQALHKEGNWLEARKLAQSLVDKFETAPASRHKLVFENELANLNQRLGFHGEAIDDYNSCLSMVGEIFGSDSTIESQLKNNLAALMQTLGDFETAEKLNREALRLRISVEGADSEEIVPAMNNLGSLLWCIGDFAGAEKLFRDGLAIRKQKLGATHLDTARSMANLSGLLFYRERTGEAAPLATEAVRIFETESGAQHPDTLEAKLFLGEILRAQGDAATALELYQSCLAGRRAAFGSDQHAEVAESRARIADAHRELGDFVEALKNYEQSNQIYDAVLRNNHPDKIPGIFGASLAAMAGGNSDAALFFARRVNEIEFFNLEAVLQFTDERQRLAYQDMFRSQHLFANLGAAEDLGTFLVRQKGLVIDSLIAESRLMKNYDNPEIEEAIEHLKRLRARYRTVFLQGTDDTNVAEEAVKRQRAAVLKLVGRDDENVLSDATILDVQKKLSPGETLVDYLVYRKYSDGYQFTKRYGAVVTTSTGISFIDCGTAESIDEIVGTLAGFLSDTSLQDDHTARDAMMSIYSELVQPALTLAPQTTTLTICPDAQLSFVPFAATIDGDGKFLVENLIVRYVSAARSLLEPESNLKPDKGAILVGNPAFSERNSATNSIGDRRGLLSTIGGASLEYVASGLTPLEGAESEVQQLSGILEAHGIPVLSMIGAPATEEKVRELVQRPYILHLATHGFYIPAFAPRPDESPSSGYSPDEVAGFHNPTFGSWVALTGAKGTVESWSQGNVPDPQSDGILMANEAAELDLEGTRVVTLSACDTATGEATGGDGVLGIRRGFRMAGAESVLTTLWPINDAVTVEIMKDFYATLGRKSAAEALSTVQRDWLVKIRDNPEAIAMPTQDGGTVPVGGLYWSLNLAAPFLLSR